MLEDVLRVANRTTVGQQALLKLKTQLPILTNEANKLRELEDARIIGGLRLSTGEYIQTVVGGKKGILFGPCVAVGPDVFNGYQEITSDLHSDGGPHGPINELEHLIFTNPDEVKTILSRDELLALAKIFEAVSRAYITHNQYNYDEEMDKLGSRSGQKHDLPYSQTYGHPQGQLSEAYKTSVIAANLRDLAEQKLQAKDS